MCACANALLVLFLLLCKHLQQLLSSSTMSDGESEWELSEESPKGSPQKLEILAPRPKSLWSTGRNVDYCSETHDNFFSGCAGYTNFGRTRKGGDRRPRAQSKEKKKVSSVLFVSLMHALTIGCMYAQMHALTIGCMYSQVPCQEPAKCTLFNFFSRDGKAPLPMATTTNTSTQKTNKKRHPAPVTRVPNRPKNVSRETEKKKLIGKLKYDVQRKRAHGELAVPAQKRQRWSGSVRSVFVCLCVCFFFSFDVGTYHQKQMQQKVDKLTKVLYEEGGGNKIETAQVLSNFVATRAVRPFVAVNAATPQETFGANVLSSLKKSKNCFKAGSPVDKFRRHLIVAGATGPISSGKISLRGMARLGGYGSNHMRLAGLLDAKRASETVDELVKQDAVCCKFKERKDKITGDPIWQKA